MPESPSQKICVVKGSVVSVTSASDAYIYREAVLLMTRRESIATLASNGIFKAFRKFTVEVVAESCGTVSAFSANPGVPSIMSQEVT